MESRLPEMYRNKGYPFGTANMTAIGVAPIRLITAEVSFDSVAIIG